MGQSLMVSQHCPILCHHTAAKSTYVYMMLFCFFKDYFYSKRSLTLQPAATVDSGSVVSIHC